MPLKMGFSNKAVGQNIKTEMAHGKGQKQAVAIAMDIRRKAKAKKMAQGGYVEQEEHNEPHPKIEYADHYSESEPDEHVMPWDGFEESEIDGHHEEYDEEPGKYANGGMGYAKGGMISPMARILGEQMLRAKKMAYGGHVDADQDEEMDENYPPFFEANRQIDIRNEGTQRPALKEASDEDDDRKEFVRRMAIHRAVRKR